MRLVWWFVKLAFWTVGRMAPDPVRSRAAHLGRERIQADRASQRSIGGKHRLLFQCLDQTDQCRLHLQGGLELPWARPPVY